MVPSPATVLAARQDCAPPMLNPGPLPVCVWHLREFTLSTDKARLDFPAIHRFLAEESYWAKAIPEGTLRRAIDHSLCFGLYGPGGCQAGFARVVSDYTTFAWVCDVFVLPAWRNQGLSKWMLLCIHSHPELQGLRRWMLGTRDAHTLYQRFGYESVNAANMLQRNVRDIYLKNREAGIASPGEVPPPLPPPLPAGTPGTG